MRLASYNVENLFERPVVLNDDGWTQDAGTGPDRWSGADLLDAYSALNTVLRKQTYSAGDRARIVTLLTTLGLDKKDDNARFVLRRNRGALLDRPAGGPVTVVAGGRSDWQGWLELKRQPVNDAATQNTARVIREVNADVLAIVEVENRTALQRFNADVLAGKNVKGKAYDHLMVIDGNDERGIDVGIMTRSGFPIVSMQSHVDDKDAKGKPLFSRDCARYDIATAKGNGITVLVNHLKSKIGGGAPRRLEQASRVRDIYNELRLAGRNHIAIVGDFNDAPNSGPMQPLLAGGADLRDISAHPSFTGDGRDGTFGNGAPSDKIDYILLSPALFATVQQGGVFRKGVWGGKNGKLFPHLDTITKVNEAASDHAAIWAELDV